MKNLVEKIKKTTLKQRVASSAIILLLLGGGTGLAVNRYNENVLADSNYKIVKADKKANLEKHLKADKEAKIKADKEAKIKAEADKQAKLKAENDAKAKAEADKQAQVKQRHKLNKRKLSQHNKPNRHKPKWLLSSLRHKLKLLNKPKPLILHLHHKHLLHRPTQLLHSLLLRNPLIKWTGRKQVVTVMNTMQVKGRIHLVEVFITVQVLTIHGVLNKN